MFSPFSKTTLSAAKGQRPNKSSPYFSPSIRRSLTPSCSRNSSFGRSYVNSILDESTNHSVETYGSPLPVLVTEAITVAEKITDISVKLEPFGYASLVCGRQLFIWKYKHNGEKIVHCRELALPPSDLAHRADLVHVFLGEEGSARPLPSALAVSPEGHVRYWRNVNHEGASVDAQPDLQGQECCCLTPLQPFGCILATTSGSLVIITPSVGEGQPGVICRTLTLPMGVLAGISRKVSSFIFGSMPAQTSETKQLNRVLATRADREGSLVYVLASSSLQKWHIAGSDRRDNLDQLLLEMDLDQDLKQRFSDGLNDNDPSFVPNLKTWCLDMQLCPSGVMIFTAGTLMARLGGTVHYAFGIVDPEQSSHKFKNFHLTSYSEPYQEDVEERLLHYKFLLPTIDNLSAYIYNSSKVLCIEIESPSIHHNELDFSTTQDVILGSGSCDGVPLFFTKDYGIVSFSLKQKAFGDPRLLATMRDVSFHDTDPKEPPESISANLRAAMCAFCANDTEKCERLIREVLSCDSGDLDAAVVGLSLGIIDDHPVSDPRWCESIPSGFVSSSLLISYQLEDKLKTHECLATFLKALHLLEMLTTFKDGDLRVTTHILLCEHAEKLAAARALRLFLNDHSEVIETAVRDALDRRNIVIKNLLTAQDVFFREVSTFHTVFPSLVDWEAEQLNADESPERKLSAIITMNKIFVGLLQAIDEQRQRSPDLFQEGAAESLPWTAREGSSGIRQHVREQLVLNVENGLNLTDSIQVQGVLFQQYVELLDLHLGTYHLQAASRKEYERERSRFIKPLLSVRQYERAAAIAEKYLDFDILIQICEETKNVNRLQRYMLQFTEQNFSQFVFKWYLDKGQKGRIFDRHLGQREVLGSFLQEHEGLRWLYFVQEEKYDAAHATLKQLALQETEFLNRKKTLLSLSKLCAMVSDVPQATKNNQIEAINLEQDLIAHQEALPISVVESCGIDPRNMRVFPPEELIEMYIAEENSTANAYDFKIALDLLGFMKKPADDSEVYSLRMYIWSKAILRDNWDTLDINNPLDSVKETVFFQIIELAFDQGVDVPDFMPSLDELIQTSELRDVMDNPSFKFLLQAGYEHILKVIA